MNILHYQKKMFNFFFKLENIFSIILILVIFVFDRFTKYKAIENLSENTLYINDYTNFNLIWNTGIGFGLFSSQSNIIYNLISLIIGILVIYLIYFALKSDKFDKIFFSIIIGGALGNFYDRITLKAVPDFIDLHYENFHWFTFNIADIFISLGIALFLMRGFFKKNI